MARTQGKTRLIVTIAIIAVAILGVAAVVLAKNNANKPAATPSTQSSQQGTTTKDAVKTDTTTPPATTDTGSATPAPTVDPSTLSSIDVPPLSISVFYTKGIHGFDFAVKKTADQTQYVEFSSSELVGTKCTNDNGLFVTIIKNPNSTEDQATISQTVKVGGDSYGLSLAGKGCTANVDLLDQYQTAFTNGFSSLKAL